MPKQVSPLWTSSISWFRKGSALWWCRAWPAWEYLHCFGLRGWEKSKHRQTTLPNRRKPHHIVTQGFGLAACFQHSLHPCNSHVPFTGSLNWPGPSPYSFFTKFLWIRYLQRKQYLKHLSWSFWGILARQTGIPIILDWGAWKTRWSQAPIPCKTFSMRQLVLIHSMGIQKKWGYIIFDVHWAKGTLHHHPAGASVNFRMLRSKTCYPVARPIP